MRGGVFYNHAKNINMKRTPPFLYKVKAWTWKLGHEEFTVSIKFKKQNYEKEEVMGALEELVKQLRARE